MQITLTDGRRSTEVPNKPSLSDAAVNTLGHFAGDDDVTRGLSKPASCSVRSSTPVGVLVPGVRTAFLQYLLVEIRLLRALLSSFVFFPQSGIVGSTFDQASIGSFGGSMVAQHGLGPRPG